MERDLATIRDAAMSVAVKDRVFREVYWMFLGAPPLTEEGRQAALSAPDVAAPIPRHYLLRLIETAKVLEEPYRSLRFRGVGADGKVKRAPKGPARPSRLALLIWYRLGPLSLLWEDVAAHWSGMTKAWSTWLSEGRPDPVPGLADRPEAAYAFKEWLDEYERAPASDDVGVEALDADEVRRQVMKRAGPSLDPDR
jgi:hypothetical protein